MTQEKTILQLWLENPENKEDKLSLAERALLCSDMTMGVVIVSSDTIPEPINDSPTNFGKLINDKNRYISTSILKWVLTNVDVSSRLPSHGIIIDSVVVNELFSLHLLKLRFPLCFRHSVFLNRFEMLGSQCHTIIFDDCVLYALDITLSHFLGNLEIRKVAIVGFTTDPNYGERSFVAIKATVDGECRIVDVRVVRDIDFLRASFKGLLDIDGLERLKRGDDPRNMEIVDLNLKSVTVGNDLFFIKCKTPLLFHINLLDCTCKNFIDDRESWPEQGGIVLNSFRYKAIQSNVGNRTLGVKHRLAWLHLQDMSHFSVQPWTQLASIYKSIGDEEAAKIVLIDKEDYQIVYGNLPFISRAWKHILSLTIGYGYRPSRALLIMLIIVLFGTGVFFSAHQRQILRPTPDRTDALLLQTEFNSFFFAVDLFVPFLDLNQDKYWVPTSMRIVIDNGLEMQQDIPCSWWYRGFYWLYICLGWLFSTLLAASWTGILKKD